MKKTALLLIGLMVSGASMAATTTQELGSGPNGYKMTTCDLLANDISIVVSQNAVGGVACNNVDNIVGLSICHTSGLTAERSSVVTTDNSGATVCTVSDTEKCIQTVSGATFPRASTTDGTVRQWFPGSGTQCTAANAVTQATALTVAQ